MWRTEQLGYDVAHSLKTTSERGGQRQRSNLLEDDEHDQALIIL